MADYDMQAQSRDINLAAAKLARKAADEFTAKTPDKPRFVAGVLGPTNRTASISPDVNDPGKRNVTFDELVEAYSESTEALIEGGADLIMLETIFDTLNAKAAAYAVESVFEKLGISLPVMVSGDYRCLRAHAVWSNRGSVLLFHATHQSILIRLKLCSWARLTTPIRG